MAVPGFRRLSRFLRSYDLPQEALGPDSSCGGEAAIAFRPPSDLTCSTASRRQGYAVPHHAAVRLEDNKCALPDRKCRVEADP